MFEKLQKLLGVNIKLRTQNVYYAVAIVLSILLPILAANGMELADIQTWEALGKVLLATVSNPYVLLTVIVAIVNATVNFDSKGLKDNQTTMNKENINQEIGVDKDILIGKLQEELETVNNELADEAPVNDVKEVKEEGNEQEE